MLNILDLSPLLCLYAVCGLNPSKTRKTFQCQVHSQVVNVYVDPNIRTGTPEED